MRKRLPFLNLLSIKLINFSEAPNDIGKNMNKFLF